MKPCMLATSVRGMYVGCASDVRGMYAGCTQDVRGMYAGCARDVRGVYAGCTRDVCGMYVGSFSGRGKMEGSMGRNLPSGFLTHDTRLIRK